jgi:peroxiredoxin
MRTSGGHHTGVVHYDLLAQLLADDRRSKQNTDWLQQLNTDERARIPTRSHPLLNKSAPDFSLSDHQNQTWSLRTQLKRGPVVLIFYLGNTCAACMHELVELNADIDKFHSLGAEVVAISADGPAQSKRLQTEFGALSFPLLTDPDHRVALAYGAVSNTQPAQPVHAALIISWTGQVSWIHSGDAPLRNNNALLYELARLEQKLPEQSNKPEQLVEQSKP